MSAKLADVYFSVFLGQVVAGGPYARYLVVPGAVSEESADLPVFIEAHWIGRHMLEVERLRLLMDQICQLGANVVFK